MRGDAVSPGPARWKQREDEDVDMLNSSWDEETTLVAMLQDGCVLRVAHIWVFPC